MNEGLDLLEGDRLFLVSPNAVLEDGMVSQELVGRTGQSFAKVLIDEDGNFKVPHYKATDILRDNRIPPQQFGFALCFSVRRGLHRRDSDCNNALSTTSIKSSQQWMGCSICGVSDSRFLQVMVRKNN